VDVLALAATATPNLIYVVLLLAAVILLGLAAFGVGGARVSVGWLGMACWALVALLTVPRLGMTREP